MKKNKSQIAAYILIAAIFFTNIPNIQAQDADSYNRGEFGIRFMPTFTSLDVQTSTGGVVKAEVILGFGIGALLAFNFTNHVGIQGEIIYNSISQKTIENDVEQKINLKYVNIPILLSLNTGKSNAINFNIVAGPQIGFNVGSSITISETNDVNAPEPILSVKKSDIGLAWGVGIDFGLNPAHTLCLGLGYRGVFGLIDVSDTSKSVTTDSYYVLDRTHVNTHSGYIGLSFLF